jgi:hypothetical protein
MQYVDYSIFASDDGRQYEFEGTLLAQVRGAAGGTGT